MFLSHCRRRCCCYCVAVAFVAAVTEIKATTKKKQEEKILRKRSIRAQIPGFYLSRKGCRKRNIFIQYLFFVKKPK